MFNYDTKPPIKNVFLYLRQSSDEREGKQVRSLLDQHDDCLRLAEHLGLNIIQVFREEKSARTPHNRPVFKQLLKALRYKDPQRRLADGILAWAPDRLSRNALESGMIMQMLDDDLIKNLYFCAYRFHHDPSGMEHLAIEFARAKGYTDRLSVNILRGTISREKQGAMLRKPKFGYIKKREDPHNPKHCSLFPIPCPKTFPIVQAIFKLRLKHYTVPEIIDTIKREFPSNHRNKLSKSTLHEILSETFYFGHWIINKGKPNERVIDLTQLSLPDGTTFTPVISSHQFYQCQHNATQLTNRTYNTYTNPIACTLTCDYCGHRMTPARRKIKRAGGRIEIQLGFECKHKSLSGNRCPQSRIKGTIIFEQFSDLLERISISRKLHAQYTIGLEKFIKKKANELKKQHIKLAAYITKLEERQGNLIQQKAALSMDGKLNDEEYQWFEKQLKTISRDLQKAQHDYKQSKLAERSKLRSFRHFVEPLKNLHKHWDKGNLEKKRAISKKLGLNLTVRDQQLESVTWKKPFDQLFISGKIRNGGAQGQSVEPSFIQLWTAFEFIDDDTFWE